MRCTPSQHRGPSIKTYPAAAVANHLLHIAKAAGESVDPMEGQKLVYFAHAWHLGYDGRRLKRRTRTGLAMGPAFPDLHHDVKT